MSTIKDVAAKACVSTATISKILNNKSGISDKTRERVLSVMKELDYKPNARAASLARKSNRNIAFLARIDSDTPYTNPHLFDIMTGAADYLSENGYTLSVYNTLGKKTVSIVEDVIGGGFADAILVHAEAVDRELALYLSREDINHIIIGHPCETRLCWIDTNHITGGQVAAEHLLEMGYRKIGIIVDNQKDSIGNSRLEGFMDTLEMHGIPVDESLIFKASYDMEGASDAAKSLLDKLDSIDAVITSSNLFAYGLSLEAERRGLSIPDSFALITFDLYPYTSIIRPMPSYVEIDVRAMGKSAAEMLLKEIDNPALKIQSFSTIPKLVIRNTTPKVN